MALGAGLGLNRNRQNTRYVLDNLGSDAVNSLVLGMSYVRMTKKYKGACLRVMRASDFSSIWVEFSLGYIAISQIAAFCAGTEGRCPEHCNQSLVAGANNAVQATWNNMPIIYSGGVFNADGLNFVAASSNYMSIVDYAAVQLTEPPIAIYANFKSSSVTGAVLSKRSATIQQFTVFNVLSGSNLWYAYFKDSTDRYAAHDMSVNSKNICVWRNKSVGGFVMKTPIQELSSTLNASLTNQPVFLVGSANYGLYLNGYIKTICIWNSDRYPDYNTFVNGGM